MLSGMQVLDSIDQAVRQALDEATVIDNEISQLTERRLRLHEQEGQACRELALLRLTARGTEQVVPPLSAAEEQARALLGRRSDTVIEIDRRLATAERERTDIAHAQAAVQQQIDAAEAALAQVEAAALKRLSESAAYRQQHEVVANADRVARHAEEKTAFAEADRVAKGKPYESDPLFMYLWQRGFATPDYRYGALSRWLDRKVARLIGYDRARANYAMLQEIPRRLEQHAERCRVAAQAEAERLEALERQALRDDAAVAAQRAELESRKTELTGILTEMEAAERKIDDIMSLRAALTSGEDSETKAALSGIVEALQRQDVRTLREQARRTPTLDDDRIVERIGEIEEDLAAVEAELQRRKAQQVAQRQRLAQLEQVRNEYRRGGYSAGAWNFGDPRMLSILLGQMLGGALSRDGFWEQMHRRRMPMPAPGGFGGGLGLPRWPGGMSGGDFGGGGGGMSMPRAPRSGGGGFRTGGTF
jgi:FtsZ-binding cell division protein ZapB/archaellum component FlaC